MLLLEALKKMLLLEEKQHLKLLIHTQWDTTIRWICLLVFLKVFFYNQLNAEDFDLHSSPHNSHGN